MLNTKIRYDPETSRWVRNGMMVEQFLTRVKDLLSSSTSDFSHGWLSGIYEYVKTHRMYSVEQERALVNVEKVTKQKEENEFNQDRADDSRFDDRRWDDLDVI